MRETILVALPNIPDGRYLETPSGLLIPQNREKQPELPENILYLPDGSYFIIKPEEPELPKIVEFEKEAKYRRLVPRWAQGLAAGLLLSGMGMLAWTGLTSAQSADKSKNAGVKTAQATNNHNCVDVIINGYQAGLPYKSVKDTRVDFTFLSFPDQASGLADFTSNKDLYINNLRATMADVITFSDSEIGMNLTYTVDPNPIQMSQNLTIYGSQIRIYDEAQRLSPPRSSESINPYPVKGYIYLMDTKNLQEVANYPGTTGYNSVNFGSVLVPLHLLFSEYDIISRKGLLKEIVGRAAMGLVDNNDRSPNPDPLSIMRSSFDNVVPLFNYRFAAWDVRNTCMKLPDNFQNRLQLPITIRNGRYN